MELEKTKELLKSLVEAGEDFQKKAKEYDSHAQNITEDDLEALKKDTEYLSLLGRLFFIRTY